VSSLPEKYDPHSRFNIEVFLYGKGAAERVWWFPYVTEPNHISVPTSSKNCAAYGDGFGEGLSAVRPFKLNTVYSATIDFFYGGYWIVYGTEFCVMKNSMGKKYLTKKLKGSRDICTVEPMDKQDEKPKKNIFEELFIRLFSF